MSIIWNFGNVLEFQSQFFLNLQSPKHLRSSIQSVDGYVTQSTAERRTWLLGILDDCIGQHWKYASECSDFVV